MTAQTILPANSAASGGFEVANSLRFNDGSSDYLSRSNGTPTSLRKYTFSAWVKKTATGALHTLYSNGTNADNYMYIHFNNSTEQLEYVDVKSGAYQVNLKTTRVFRDPSAWYHIMIAVDTTQGTNTNRVKFYINGVQETSFVETTYPDQNDDLILNGSNTNIGRYVIESSRYYDGYMSEVVFVDGTQQANTDLGEFDSDSGIWKPIDVSGLTFGDNGFYCEFKETGTSANASGIGADTSGNTNHLSVTNITATDQATDTCTNNFCTMNPLIPTTNATFSQGNCKLTIGGSSIQGAGIGTFGLTAGKWYFEVKLLADKDNHTHGAISELTAELNANVTAIQNDVGVTSWINGDGGEVVVDGTATTADYGIMAENSIMGIALDIDNYNITYLDDNSALVSNFNMSSTRGTIFPLIKMGINCAAEVNFGGCSAFAVSSANSDADGHGNFEHAPPSGYFAICSKNLAEYG